MLFTNEMPRTLKGRSALPCYYVKLPGNKLTGHIDSATQVTDCRYEELEKYQSSACETINK